MKKRGLLLVVSCLIFLSIGAELFLNDQKKIVQQNQTSYEIMMDEDNNESELEKGLLSVPFVGVVSDFFQFIQEF